MIFFSNIFNDVSSTWVKDSFEQNQGHPKIYENHQFIQGHAPLHEMTTSSSAILAALSLAAHQLEERLWIMAPIFSPLPHAYQRHHRPPFCGGAAECGEANSYDFFSLLPHLFLLPPFLYPTPFFLYKFNPCFPFQPSSSPLSFLALLPMLLSLSRCSLLEGSSGIVS